MAQRKPRVPLSIQQMAVNALATGIIVTKPGTGKKLSLLDWTMKYRRFGSHPPSIPYPLIDIYNDTHHEVVVMKAAQVFVSEWGINIVLWAADTKHADRGTSLYVFPKQEQMDDFSQARVNNAIEQSPYLTDKISSLDRRTSTNRVRLRRVAGSAIYFRGSDSESQIRAVDADVVIADEVDLWKEGVIEKAKERLGSSLYPLFRGFSQPQYPGGPIDQLYEKSDQRHYYVPCGSCGEKQHLLWDENVVFSDDLTNVKIICRKCKQPMDRLAKGEWVAHNRNAYSHGYHISKLYSPRADLEAMARKSVNLTEDGAIQSFYNADLGIPYKPSGTPGLGDYRIEAYPTHQPMAESYLGCDPGKMLHTVVLGRPSYGEPLRLIYWSPLPDFNGSAKTPGLEEIWNEYHPRKGIIDAGGEPRATKTWAMQHYGRVLRWSHRPNKPEPIYPNDSDEVHMERTALLDFLYGTLKRQEVWLPAGIERDFLEHLESNIREIKKDKNGRLIPIYTPQRADHYAFALAFAILAAGFGSTSGQPVVVSRDGAMPVAVQHVGEMDTPVQVSSPLWTSTGGPGRWPRR